MKTSVCDYLSTCKEATTLLSHITVAQNLDQLKVSSYFINVTAGEKKK